MSVGSLLSIEQAMSLALEQARQGLGRVAPNPPVGAVILDKNRRCLSIGHHQAHGENHAEIMALNKVQDLKLIQGAVLVVTLEPCPEKGLTPSCARRLAQLPFSKIYYGLLDPRPKAHGLGVKIIQSAGISVEMYQGPLKEQLEELIEVYTHNVSYSKPFVGLKIASSLDGWITKKHQKWITGKSARGHLALLRGHYTAVCVGVNTLLEDNPRLNSRHPNFEGSTNQAVILDPEGRSLDFIKQSKLLQVRKADQIVVVTRPIGKKSDFCIILEQEVNQGRFDLDELLKQLFQKNIRSLLVEGGAVAFNSFLRHFQRMYLFLAPSIQGSSKGQKNWIQALNSDGISLKRVKVSSFDQDALITGLNESVK